MIHPYLRVLSDLHVDVNPPHLVRLAPLTTDAESILVLAGDYGSPKKLADWLKLAAGSFLHTVVILGNHDYWGMSVERAPEKWRESLANHLPESIFSRVTLLERDTVDVAGIRFIGTTLWSDFDEGDPWALRAAQETMQDHKRIRARCGTKRFLPQDALRWHRDTRRWLEGAMAEPWGGPKVVLTHHAPSWASLHPHFRADDLAGAYASRLDETIRTAAQSGVCLWVHGHTHHAVDYVQDGVRILSNPFGYPSEGTGVKLDDVIAL
ncbi:metallophosphoesterase [Acidithiobacillus caldus]|uniref:metallophosphoesterase n=1 Tax=Acidithiobacillus caldus TaxID=33059 RepID=UPI001C075930|nr:metallophosphoesterase [Acidithiobacillus caldus]MBU2803128.1 metallophosphoesterase [Acidithiobacillus caldus]